MTPESFSRQGADRTANEDRAAIAELPGGYALVLADGMGGKDCGAMAAELVAQTVADSLLVGSVSLPEALRHADSRLRDMNTRLRTRSGCTVAVALVQASRCHFSWQGNVRLYHARGGTWQLLTRDHVLPIGYGLQRVSRCVKGCGLRDDVPDCEIELQSGDSLLLCSDGFYNSIDGPLPDAATLPAVAEILTYADDASYILLKV